MNENRFCLYKTSPAAPDAPAITRTLMSADSLTECLDAAMTDIYAELHDGDGENGGNGSLWRCAREIYDCLEAGRHYAYADCEWWIVRMPYRPKERTWTFRFSAVLDTSFTLKGESYEETKARSDKIAKERADRLKEYVGRCLLEWGYDGNYNDEGETEIQD